jgi:hypothetical protein
MPPLWISLLTALLSLMPEQSALVLDPVHARYHEALAAEPTEGLVSFVSRLDSAATASPAASYTPHLLEQIQIVGLLHPGSVPDRAARFENLRSQAGNPQTAAVVRRIDILEKYFAAAAQGRPDLAAPALSDPVLQDLTCVRQARADAAFRSGNLTEAKGLSLAAIEEDPFSPTLAPSYVLLGLCESSAGNRLAAVRYLQRALSVSPLPTIYGRTQDYLAVLSRFVRPSPGAVGEVFDETTATRLAGVANLKDPRALYFTGGRFILIDREQMLGVSTDAKVLETKAARRLEDVATNLAGVNYYVAEDSVDLGTGSLVKVPVLVGGKQKTLNKLRSIAVSSRGDVFLLDQDSGLFRLSAEALAGPKPAAGMAPSPTPITVVRGRQLRIDRRGYLYVLGIDEKSVQILSPEGKPLASLAGGGARESVVEYFALDLLNNAYLLDSANNVFLVFAVKETGAGIDVERIASIALDARPQYRNLKLIGVSQTGEVVATGKNDETWVLYR